MRRRPGPFDPSTGQVHVLAERCSTCVFHPGNLMHLHPGRLKDLIDTNVRNDSALTCHSTLPNNDSRAQPAVCRGFYDAYPTMPLKVARALDAVTYDPAPPPKEGHHLMTDNTERYYGAENATVERVRRYLVENFVDVSDARASALIGDHRDLVNTGIAMVSHAAYVGDQIADREELVWIEDEAGDDA